MGNTNQKQEVSRAVSRSGCRLKIRWTRFYWVKLNRLTRSCAWLLLHVSVLGGYTFLCFLSTFVSAMCYHKRKYLWENSGVTEGFGHSRDVGGSREQE